MLSKAQKNKLLLAVTIVFVGTIVAIVYFSKGSQESSPAIQSTQPTQQFQTQGGIPQPPGAAPLGKVWSPEHGHWHDLSDLLPGSTQTQVQLTPQPPGPVPPGKVWFPEHGHWHDAPSVRIIDQDALIRPDTQ